MNAERPPSGLARRGRRLSDQETQQRMLRAAIDMVQSGGLTVSLDHLSFEDVIRDAEVSRSAVYRRWPYKDLFFSDLLKELAKLASPGPVPDTELTELTRQVVLPRLDRLHTPQDRQATLAELLRQTTMRHFQAMHGSPQWHTYLALHATFLGLDQGQFRTDMQAALAESERAFVARVTASCEHVSRLLGYRPRADAGVTFETVARLAGAALCGLALMAVTTPDITTARTQAAPFGTEPADWSEAALAVTGVALAFLEPDPTIDWTDDHRAGLRTILDG